MKKLIFILIILSLLVTSCNSQPQAIRNINLKGQEVSKVVSVSIIENVNGLQLRFLARQNNKLMTVSYSIIGKKDILNLDYNFIADSIMAINYKIRDFNKNLVREKYFFVKEDKSTERTYSLKTSESKLDNVLAWGEGSIKGTKIPYNKLSSVTVNKGKIKGKIWDLIEGEYNLEEKTPSIVEQQGVFKLWYSSSDNISIELYKGMKGKKLVIRQVWLNEKAWFSFDIDKDADTLINCFLRYYDKVIFGDFMVD